MRIYLLILTLALCVIARSELTVDNVKPGELVRYPVISVRGKCSAEKVTIGLSQPTLKPVEVENGDYIGLVELKPGINMVFIVSGKESIKIRVDYRPMKSVYRLRAIWYTSSDEGEDYPYEVPGKKQRLREKLDTALKVMQTFTAEAMEQAGYGKKTFALDVDSNGKVNVTVVKSTHTGVELREANNDKTWTEAYEQIKPIYDESKNKYATVMAFSRWDTATQKSKGAFALGGGALGMIYGGTVAMWPNSVSEVQSAFADATFVDRAKTYEDSGNRHTVWANVATAYGAWLHELGHTFGLPHCADRFGIMSRGFDFFNRRFMLVEPPVYGKEKGVAFGPKEVSYWEPFQAAKLNWSPWFQPDAKPFETSGGPKVEVAGDVVTISAARGIRVAGAELDDKFPYFQEFNDPKPPTKIIYSLDQLRKAIKSDKKVRISVVDAEGNLTFFDA